MIRYFLAAGLVTLFAPVLMAQQPGVTPRDSAAIADSIRADSITRSRAQRLKPVIITGTRLTDVDERTPNQVESLDLHHIAPGPDASFAAIQRLPGVTFFDDQGARLQPELEVRGFTLSPVVGTPQGISVYLDGVRVNEPDAQEVNFDLLPMAAVEHASLVRGSQALFGRNSLGGTILLTTRRGDDRPDAELEVGGGSFGERNLALTAGGKLGGFDGFIMASGSNEDGWREATAAQTRLVMATVGRRKGTVSDSGDIALSVLYGNNRIHEAGSLPESYIAVNPRINYTPGDFFSPELLQVSLRGANPLWGGTFRGTLFGRRNAYEQYNGNVPPPNTDGFIRNLSGGVTAEWTRPLQLGSVPVALTVGGEYAREDIRFRLVSVGGGLPDSLATLANVNQDAASLYAQAILTPLPALAITAALRGDYVHIPYRDELDPTNNGTNTYDELSPQIGLTYSLTDDVRGFVAYKSAFRAPAPLELACASPDAPCPLPSALGADPALRPVTTRDYEAGFDVELSPRTSLDVDAFWTDVRDDILFASPDLTHVYFVNVPKTRRAGVELSGRLGLPAGLRVAASYSYVATTFQSTVQLASGEENPEPARPGDRFPASPLHRGRVSLGITRATRRAVFDGEVSLRAYSSQFLRGDESNQEKPVPGYAVTAIQGQAHWGRYGVQAGIENLFNRSYYTFGIYAENSLGPPGSATPPDVPPIERFLTPGYPRRFTFSVSAKL